MYTVQNFKTKKALKAAVAAWNACANVQANAAAIMAGGNAAPAARPVTYFQPGPFGGNEPRDGTLYLEGPHYPEPHRWYAQATARDGIIVAVK